MLKEVRAKIFQTIDFFFKFLLKSDNELVAPESPLPPPPPPLPKKKKKIWGVNVLNTKKSTVTLNKCNASVTPQAAQMLSVTCIRDSIALRFAPFKRMHEFKMVKKSLQI